MEKQKDRKVLGSLTWTLCGILEDERENVL